MIIYVGREFHLGLDLILAFDLPGSMGAGDCVPCHVADIDLHYNGISLLGCKGAKHLCI
jgi:hypothetical protein